MWEKRLDKVSQSTQSFVIMLSPPHHLDNVQVIHAAAVRAKRRRDRVLHGEVFRLGEKTNRNHTHTKQKQKQKNRGHKTAKYNSTKNKTDQQEQSSKQATTKTTTTAVFLPVVCCHMPPTKQHIQLPPFLTELLKKNKKTCSTAIPVSIQTMKSDRDHRRHPSSPTSFPPLWSPTPIMVIRQGGGVKITNLSVRVPVIKKTYLHLLARWCTRCIYPRRGRYIILKHLLGERQRICLFRVVVMATVQPGRGGTTTNLHQ